MRKVLGVVLWGIGAAICLFYVGFLLSMRMAQPVLHEQAAEILRLEETNFNLQNQYYELERAYNELKEGK